MKEQNYLDLEQIANDDISLKELFYKVREWIQFLGSKLKLIFLSLLIGSLLGLFYGFFEKTTYIANLTFALEEDKTSSGLSGALGLASNLGIDIGNSGGGVFAASNLTELMKSRLIVEKVLLSPIYISNKYTSLLEYYIKINNMDDSWKSKSKLNNIKFPPHIESSKLTFQQDSIIKIIYLNLINKNNLNIVQRDKKVTILTIEVKSHDEFFSKQFCEMLAKETSDYYIETKSKKARNNVEVLQKQVDSIRNELNGAIYNVAEELDNVYNLNPAFNKKGTRSKKRQIDVQSNSSILTNLIVQLELAKITLRKETPLIQTIDMPILPLDIEKVGKIKSTIFGGVIFFLLTILYLIIVRKLL